MRRVDAALVRGIEYEAPAAPAPAAPPASAASSTSGPPDKNVFSLAFGLGAPLDDVGFGAVGGGTANDGDIGPLLGARWLRELDGKLALGADLEYFHRGATNSPGLLPLANSSVSGDNFLFMGVARWYLTERGNARPYVLGGAGVSRSWTRVDSAPRPGFAWTDTNTDEARRLIDDGAWALAGTARAGVDFGWELMGPALFGLEAGYTWLQRRRFEATPAGRDLGLTGVDGALRVFTFAARWSWRW
ncbi:MAG: hypothetical protein M0D55_14900 [Elusimicrobiota bacterium]|nr:MAG: hypothetical protein M0D55_14900 [Elusimicrobiota bacterium]